jgi:hypothetical protein
LKGGQEIKVKMRSGGPLIKGKLTTIENESFSVDGKTFSYAEVKSVEKTD